MIARAEFRHSLADFVARDVDRYCAEVGELEDLDGRETSDARRAGNLVDPGLSGAFYRAWLYSGSVDGAVYGPAQPGHLKCRESRTAARRDFRSDEEIDRDKRYRAIVFSLAWVDRLLLAYYAIAHRKSPTDWVGWIAAQLNERGHTNAHGEMWTVAAVRKRMTRIDQVIAEDLVNWRGL